MSMKPKPWTWLWMIIAVTLGATAAVLMFQREWPLRIFGACIALVLFIGARHERIDHWYSSDSDE
jgi:hypothetical protein